MDLRHSDGDLARKYPALQRKTYLEKDVRSCEHSSPLHPKQLRQLIRHRSIHLGRIDVIEILRATSCLSLGQHLLDVRRELDCPNGIVVKYLAEFRCEPRLHDDVRRTPV